MNNFVYTNEMYNEDLKTCQIVYNKHFKKFYKHKEDLLQVGLTYCLKVRQNFDDSQGFKYFSYAFKCVHGQMINWLKKYVIKHEFNKISGDEYLPGGDITLFETLEDTSCNDFDSSLNVEQIFKIAYSVANNLHTERQKEIANLFIKNNFSCLGLDKKLNMSRQAVFCVIDKFRKILFKKLNENDFYN